MGLFNWNACEPKTVYAPIDGQITLLENVPDPTFSEKLIGDGIAIEPMNDLITSPVNGEVCMVFPTKHAIGLRMDDGTELLIHIGIETVNLNGKGFETFVRKGQRVRMGQKLVSFDRKLVVTEGFLTTVMILATNRKVNTVGAGEIRRKEKVFSVYE